MFDRDLFLKLCKDYGVPLSSDYKVPMLRENGELKEFKLECDKYYLRSSSSIDLYILCISKLKFCVLLK